MRAFIISAILALAVLFGAASAHAADPWVIRQIVWSNPGTQGGGSDAQGSALTPNAAYVGMTDAQIATALNALTVTSAQVPVPTASIQAIVVPTLEMAKIHFTWAGKTVSSVTSPTSADQLVMIANEIEFLLTNYQAIPINLESAFGQGMTALVTAGVLSQASATAITALATPQIPQFSPPLTATDVYSARFAQ